MKSGKRKFAPFHGAESGNNLPARGRVGVLALVAGFLSIFLAWPARAQLTVTVIPGYQLGPLETPTTATLNALATPTITISGTIGGTNNVTLAAGSVSGLYLANSVPDGITVVWNASSPRQLSVGTNNPGTTGGITDTNVAWNAGINLGKLALNLDPSSALGTNSSGANGAALIDTNNWAWLTINPGAGQFGPTHPKGYFLPNGMAPG